MTVSATNAYSALIGNGLNTVFPFNFAVRDAAEVQVIVNDVVVTSGFVTALNANGGNVTFTTAPADQARILIASDPSFHQDIDFENNGAFLPDAHDEANDRATIRDIWLRHGVKRSIRLPVGEEVPEIAATDERTSDGMPKILGFNPENGHPEVMDGSDFAGEAGEDAPLPWRQEFLALAGQTDFVVPEYDPTTVCFKVNGLELLHSDLDLTVPLQISVIEPLALDDEIIISAYDLGGGADGSGTGLPEGWASVKDYGAVGDGVTDDTDALQDCFDDDDFPVKYIPPGTYMVNSAGLYLSDSATVLGAGRGVTVLKRIPLAISDNQPSPPWVIGTDLGADDITLSDFSVDCSKSGLGRGSANRCHGVVLRTDKRSDIARVDVYDCTGYAFWHNGTNDAAALDAAGIVTDCYVENAEVPFEQIFASNVLLDRCMYRDGDDDVPTEAIFHQYGTCDQIEARNCDFEGSAGSGFNLLAEFSTATGMGTIKFTNSRMKVIGNTVALFVAGSDGLEALEIMGSMVWSTGNNGANIGIADAKYNFTSSTFHGLTVGLGVGTGCDVTMVNSHAWATSTISGDTAFGAYVDSGGSITSLGGTLQGENTANAPNAQPYAGNVSVLNTELIPNTGAAQTNFTGNVAASLGLRAQGIPYLGGIAEDEVPMVEIGYNTATGQGYIQAQDRGNLVNKDLYLTGRKVFLRCGVLNSEELAIEIDESGNILLPNIPTSSAGLPSKALYMSGTTVSRIA